MSNPNQLALATTLFVFSNHFIGLNFNDHTTVFSATLGSAITSDRISSPHPLHMDLIITKP